MTKIDSFNEKKKKNDIYNLFGVEHYRIHIFHTMAHRSVIYNFLEYLNLDEQLPLWDRFSGWGPQRTALRKQVQSLKLQERR